MTPAGPLAKVGFDLGLYTDLKMFLGLVKSLEDLPTQETGGCDGEVVSNTPQVSPHGVKHSPSLSPARMNCRVLAELTFQCKTRSSAGADGTSEHREGFGHR